MRYLDNVGYEVGQLFVHLDLLLVLFNLFLQALVLLAQEHHLIL